MNAFPRIITGASAAGLALAAAVAITASHMALYDVVRSVEVGSYGLARFNNSAEQCMVGPGKIDCWVVWSPPGR